MSPNSSTSSIYSPQKYHTAMQMPPLYLTTESCYSSSQKRRNIEQHARPHRMEDAAHAYAATSLFHIRHSSPYSTYFCCAHTLTALRRGERSRHPFKRTAHADRPAHRRGGHREIDAGRPALYPVPESYTGRSARFSPLHLVAPRSAHNLARYYQRITQRAAGFSPQRHTLPADGRTASL